MLGLILAITIQIRVLRKLNLVREKLFFVIYYEYFPIS